MKNTKSIKIDGKCKDKIIDLSKYKKISQSDGIIGNNALKMYVKDETAYDIISIESVINFKKYNKYNINEEGMYMKKSIMYDVLKEQLKFLMTSIILIILSLIALIFYYKNGFYFIHPTIYLVTLFMGIGWGATAIYSIRNNKVKLNEK